MPGVGCELLRDIDRYAGGGGDLLQCCLIAPGCGGHISQADLPGIQRSSELLLLNAYSPNVLGVAFLAADRLACSKSDEGDCTSKPEPRRSSRQQPGSQAAQCPSHASGGTCCGSLGRSGST